MCQWRNFLLSVAVAICLASAAAQAQSAGDENTKLFHQGITTGCIYELKTDPKAASFPAELRDQLCSCVDKWFQDNNLNDQKSVEANKQIMPQVFMYCLQTVVGK